MSAASIRIQLVAVRSVITSITTESLVAASPIRCGIKRWTARIVLSCFCGKLVLRVPSVCSGDFRSDGVYFKRGAG